MAVSKRLRFEILRRDNHTCRYCGRSAPDVLLHVDHVVPVAFGGTDDPSNLVAACKDCNIGKSSVPADAAIVEDIATDAMRWSLAMRQAANEIAEEEASLEEICVAIEKAWAPRWIPDNYRNSLYSIVKAGLTLDDLLTLVDVAKYARWIDDRWAYFCGCCWTRVGQRHERARQIIDSPPDGVTNSNSSAALITTKWTIGEICEFEKVAREFATEWCGEEFVAEIEEKSAPCRHGARNHCGDPVCIAEHATCLYILGEKIKPNKERVEAVTAAAEALLDG